MRRSADTGDAYSRFVEVDRVLQRALDLPRQERESFLIELGRRDQQLRGAVERLLAASEEASPLDNSAFASLGRDEVFEELPPGTRLATYELLEFLAAGGMGRVYRAIDHKLGREVALKVLPDALADSADRRARFEREAHLLASLNHPNLATIHALEDVDGCYFLVLELVPGHTIADLLRDGPLSPPRALEIAGQIADGLRCAHAAGIIHRDLKPSNVVVRPDGRVKIVDFGVATALQDDVVADAVLGTARYMSPEQWRREPVDARADVWAFGCVLYEMLTARPAFGGRTATELRAAIFGTEPDWAACPRSLPGRVQTLLRRCLEKDPERRLLDVADARTDIAAALVDADAAALSAPRRAVRRWAASFLLLVLAVATLGAVLWQTRTADRVWALDEAFREMARLMDADDYGAVHALARRVERILGSHPRLEEVWQESSGVLEVTTQPAGAQVTLREYEADEGNWLRVGVTPVRISRFPRGTYRVRIEKPGYAAVEVPYTVALASFVETRTASGLRSADDHSTCLDFELVAQSELPSEMIRVEGGPYHPVPLSGINYFHRVHVPDFFVDRTEVTNGKFQEFVDAGGYRTREWWPDSAEVRDDIVSRLRDRTGTPAPASWENGRYPKNTSELPVTGVSAAEAAAYCAFRGKQLPTLYHWARAAFPSWDDGVPLSPVMARLGNFSQTGPAPVASHRALSVSGAFDMAGNVAEWTSTRGAEGHYALGGSWRDPSYVTTVAVVTKSGERNDAVGFRCVRYADGPEVEALKAPVVLAKLDWEGAPVMSDEAFEHTRRLHAYADTPLAAQVDSTQELSWGAIEQWTSIDAAYGGERIPIRLRIPRDAVPPYQCVVVVHSSQMLLARDLSEYSFEPWHRFIVQSGRVLVEPVLSGTWHRQAGNAAAAFLRTTTAGRDHYLRLWVQDIGRTIDYLQERPDLDERRVAYLGTSMGSIIAPSFLAYESRFSAAVLWAGGFAPFESPERVTLRANLVRRTTVPLLLLQGRYDYQMPLEYQQVMMRLLGTPADHKRHRVFEASHWPYPRGELIAETLGWFDRYLGPADGSALSVAE